MSKNYTIISNTKAEDAQIELVVQTTSQYIDEFSEKALDQFVQEAEIEGFRKGKAPKNLVQEKVGEFAIFQEATQRAIQELIPSIIENEKFDVITMPHVHITKIATGSPVEFKMHFYVMPTIDLADYKKIAKGIKKEKNELKEEEVTGYIEQILNARAVKDEKGEVTKPELNDDFVKQLGNFKDVADFKTQLTENMKRDKELQEIQKRRVAIIEKIINETKIDLPGILVEEEEHKMIDEFKNRVESMKMNFEEYLKTIKKTEEELKKEWKADATKRAQMNIILPQIAQKESIKPEEKDIDHEIEHLKQHYKDLDESRARIYVAGVLTNEAVFKFLETL